MFVSEVTFFLRKPTGRKPPFWRVPEQRDSAEQLLAVVNLISR